MSVTNAEYSNPDENNKDLFSQIFESLKTAPTSVEYLEMAPIVYLAGPIESYLEEETPYSIAWRELVKTLFESDTEYVWDVRDPNSGKHDGVKYVRCPENEHYYNSHVIFRTDLKNVADCDFFLVNLSDSSKKLSSGTLFELGYAYALNKTIVCIVEPDYGEPHPFIKESVNVFVTSEIEAVEVIRFLLKQDES